MSIRVPRIAWDLTLASGSGMLMVFLLVLDELFTLDLYCRTSWQNGYDSSTFCVYPYPWGFGSGSGYTPWEFAFGMIMLSVMLIGLSFYKLGTWQSPGKNMGVGVS